MPADTRAFPSTPTITAGAYSANDVVGEVVTLTGAGQGGSSVHTLTLYDVGGIGSQLDLVLYSATPSVPVADNGAFAVNAADIAKVIGVISIATADYLAAGTPKIATVKNINLGYMSTADGNLYAQFVTRGTPTYASTSGLRLCLLVIPL